MRPSSFSHFSYLIGYHYIPPAQEIIADLLMIAATLVQSRRGYSRRHCIWDIRVVTLWAPGVGARIRDPPAGGRGEAAGWRKPGAWRGGAGVHYRDIILAMAMMIP